MAHGALGADGVRSRAFEFAFFWEMRASDAGRFASIRSRPIEYEGPRATRPS